MEINSKKRTLSGTSFMKEEEEKAYKKIIMAGDGSYHLKMLVPSVAAGAIIGKGGETIAEIQKSVGARVKMSKPNDFYPGTNERVCLITGSLDAIATIVNFLNTKIKEKPDPNAKPAIDFDNKIAAERERQMKVIVPNSTAGMIIGKGGSFIKHLKEQSGAFIQLSQKSKETPLPERVITVIGDDDNLRVALNLILQKVSEDPQSGSCLNISYKITNGPVANPNPTGSPFANGVDPCTGEVNGMKENEGYALPLVGGGTLSLKLNFNPHLQADDARVMTQYLGHINACLKIKGYNDKVADEITKGFGVLSLHGVLQVDMMIPQIGAAIMTDSQIPPPSFPIIDAMQAMPPPASPDQASPQHLMLGPPLPGANPMTGTPLPPAQQPPPPENNVITDSLRANMGLPPPPPTPPNQGPFGPTGLIPGAGPPPQQQEGAPGPPIDLQSPFKRPNGPTEFNGLLPVNHNSFGLATAGNPLPSLTQAQAQDAVVGGHFALAQQQTVPATVTAVQPRPGQHMAPPPLPLTATSPPANESINKIDIEVSESLVGAVIGQGGQSIVEIQQCSGTNIQISKKGNYSPGTRNRVVTITGPQKCLNAAQFMINQKVVEEELKRQHNAGQHINLGF